MVCRSRALNLHRPLNPDLTHTFPHLSTPLASQVLNLEAMRPLTPRIDVYDHSNGAQPPAFAASPTIGALGSEDLFVGLGCGVIGVYSLATGVTCDVWQV